MSSAAVSGHDEFGGYVLLKKLGEDTLGETYRAGKLGSGGMQQVVLLKIWNGAGTDPEALWRHLNTKGPVQAALRSPNVASGIDLGRVRNIPYSVYDYISGKSLSSLLTQIGRERSPLPTDHALLIADRIALGVSVGYETKVADQRVLHGYLVPQLLMLGNEGDMRLLGFEAAQGLRAGGAPAPDLARFLSPEALAGAPVNKADDVYSLGAILYELLTAERLPTQGARAAVDSARLANDGMPLPADISALIKKSLAPQAERFSDVIAWHRALSKVSVEGQYNATTFNLAFFMHNLFRDEIDRESKEIEKERTQTFSKRDFQSATSAAAAAPSTRPVHPTPSPTSAPTPPPAALATDEQPEGGNKQLLWGGIAALVLVGAGLIVYFGVIKKSAETAPTTDTTAQMAPASEVTDPAADATITAEPPNPEQEAELRNELDKLLAERTAAMEKNLRSQYDEKIRALQQSLEQSQRPAASPSTTVASRPTSAPPPTTPVTTAPPQAEPAPAPASLEPEPKNEPEQLAANTVAEPEAPPTQPPAVSEPAAPRKPQVRVGDLVEAGPGVVAPKLKTMPNPIYPPAAKRLNKTAVVTVRVLVDENGRVQRAELGGADPGFGFGDAALAAARGARFDAATSQGVRVKMWTSIRVSFQP